MVVNVGVEYVTGAQPVESLEGKPGSYIREEVRISASETPTNAIAR